MGKVWVVKNLGVSASQRDPLVILLAARSELLGEVAYELMIEVIFHWMVPTSRLKCQSTSRVFQLI